MVTPSPSAAVSAASTVESKSPTSQSSTKPTSNRLLSIDALRGFDMFWITGGDALAVAVLGLIGTDWANGLKAQFDHVEWEGFRFYDLIFPLFLFLVGCVLPFSLEKFQSNPSSAYLRILRRTLALFLLGVICNGLFQLAWIKILPPESTEGTRSWTIDIGQIRIAGVLQRIAVCYFFAALLCLHLKARWQVVAFVSILVIYWALLSFVALPGGIPGDFSKEGNLSGAIDRAYLPGKILKPYYGFGDNEGLLSTFPAIATALLGVLAGHWLRSPVSPWRKAIGLAVVGVIFVELGTVLGYNHPIIKNIWTSTFVLVAGGYSLCLLALFYAIIDVIGWKNWSFYWVVIGANAITIYVGQRFIDFNKMSQFFLGGVTRLLKESGYTQWSTVILWVGILTAQWLFLLLLYRKRIFLRV